MKQELKKDIDSYIEKYYVPENDDIRMDKEIKSIFQKITDFRLKRAEAKKCEDSEDMDSPVLLQQIEKLMI